MVMGANKSWLRHPRTRRDDSIHRLSCEQFGLPCYFPRDTEAQNLLAYSAYALEGHWEDQLAIRMIELVTSSYVTLRANNIVIPPFLARASSIPLTRVVVEVAYGCFGAD